MKNLVRSITAFLLLVTAQHLLLAQNLPSFQCGSDEAMQSRPELLERQQALEKTILQKHGNGGSEKSGIPPYTLPVVVHIIHDNGVGDIPDSQVFDAIEQLNQAFAHQGYYAAQGAGFDTQIQFCLAKSDPDGNITNGITRTSSVLTNMDKDFEDQELKDLSRWQPKDYINIWVVNTINSTSSGPGVVGYAYLASAHGQPFDGIVCEAAYFGTSPQNTSVVVHEMGHYLNLYHTFQGGCQNDDCQTDGDRVCDTPPDQVTFSSCNYNSCGTDTDDTSANNPFASDVPDMTENYMDYSPKECFHAFTPGQAERMYDAIELFRNSLLESEGCIDPCTIPISADFTASATDIFVGETISFTNLTTGGTVFEWSIGGAVISNSFDAEYTFNDVGVFEIVLSVGNDDANCEEIANVVINVKCPIVAGFIVNTMELEVGEAFMATNTSQNATGYEWWINGVLVSTDADLSYIFNDGGIYTIVLDATGNFCSHSYSALIKVLTEGCYEPIQGGLFQQINTSGNQIAFIDITSNDNVYFTAPSSGYKLIGRLNKNGELLWQTKYEVAQTGTHEQFLLKDEGFFAHYGENDEAEQYLIKLDSLGNHEWSMIADIADDDFIKAVPYKSGIALFGTDKFSSKFYSIGIELNGNIKWNKVFDLSKEFSISEVTVSTEQNAFWVAGNGGGFPDFSGVIMKLDSLGQILFIKQCSSPDGNRVIFREIESASNGGFAVVGSKYQANNESDFMILKGDQEAEVLWGKGAKPMSDENETGISIVANPSNSGFIAQLWDIQTGNINKWLSFSESGILEYAKSFAWDTGQKMQLRLTNRNGQLFASWADLNAKFFYVEFAPEKGPKMDCAISTDYDFDTYDLEFACSYISYSLTNETVSFFNHTFTELSANENIDRLTLCPYSTPCPEDCTNSIDDDEDGYVDCFDEDCDCSNGEDCNGITQITYPPIQPKVDWLTAENWADMSNTPMVANLDPQNGNLPEIVIVEGTPNVLNVAKVNKVLIYQGDGSNAASPDILEIPEYISRRNVNPAIGDINGDGIPELAIVTLDKHIRVYSNFSPGNIPAMTPFAVSDFPLNRVTTRLGMADFDQDGIPEIYGENYIFKFDLTNPTNPQLIRCTQGNGHIGLGVGSTKSTAYDLLRPIDCNGDPDCEGLELIAGAYIYSVDLDPLDGDGIQIKVARNLNDMVSGYELLDGYSYVADLNLDGIPDIATSSSLSTDPDDPTVNGIYVWDKNGLHDFLEYPNSSRQFAALSIANVFDDKEDGFALDFPEIIATTSSEIISFNLQAAQAIPATPYWWKAPFDDFTSSAGSTCFDLNGDGMMEIICRDAELLRVLYAGPAPFPAGVASDRTWWKMECNSQTIDEAPIVVDVDADGEAEILVAGYLPPYDITQLDYRGRIWVIESDTTPWMPARPIWNQFNYFGLNVNDDLTIPRQQQAIHLEFPSLGSGKRPFNTANCQIPTLDDSFNPIVPVSDATIEVDSFLCDLDSLDIWLTICNQGSKVLPDSTPISIYQNDPTTSAATLIATSMTTSALPVDSCFSFSLKIAAVYNTPIFVLVNDNGTLATPFDPMVDFPNTGVLECDYENNLAQFEWSHQNPLLDLGPDIATCSSSTNTLNAGSGFTKYRWKDGSEDSIFTAWEPGKYWVDAWDICGYKQTDTVVISLDQTSVFDLGDDIVICEGEIISLEVVGYTEVQWWPTEGLSCADCPIVEVTPTTSVTYYATGKEGNCFATDSIHISVFPKPEFEFLITSSGCNQPTLIEAIPISTEALEYAWSNGEAGPSIQVNQSGNYWVTVTNTFGCQTVDSIYANHSGNVEFTASTTPILCFGEMGSIHLDILQTAPPYEILWSNGESTDSLTNLPPGVYGVIVTDSNGCFAAETFTLDDPTEMTIAPTVSNISCNNDPGQIAINADGGTGTLSYLWSNGATTPSISTSVPGSYSATVTDDNGCTANFEQDLIADPPPLAVSILFTEIQCPGGMDGTATLMPLNGTPPFFYEWGNGQTDSILTGLGSEPHSVTITDALGCEKEITFNLTEPDSLEIEISASAVQCFGEMNGSASATVVGGSPSFHYLWSNGVTAPTIGNLAPGQYSLTITDDHGCQDSSAILIEEPFLLNLVATANPPQICPNETAELSALAAGGTPPYTYEWNGSMSDSLLENASAGIYEIIVTDANGCTSIETIVVNAFALPDSVQTSIQPATGATVNDGTIAVEEIIGGTPPFSYLWSNGSTTQSIDNLLPGIYSLTLTDGMGCQSIFEYVVEVMVATGEKTATHFSVALFPNPVYQNGAAVLSFKNNAAQRFEISLFEMTGRLIKKEQVQMGVGAFTHNIQAPDASGVFLIQINGEDGKRVYFKWVVAGE